MASKGRKGGGKSPQDTTGKQLVIVESPAKAKTINRYLGSDFVVMASVGHIRDLPNKNPKGVKDPVPGVDLENDFAPTYKVIRGKTKTVAGLKKAADAASGIWLATDLDREGEAIAWHLTSALKVRPEDANRVVFNAITKSEIEKAFRNPRKIDIHKVNAQQARRILDRIVGYQVSPLLWKKVAGGLSAGRVQSVAVRLIVEREREIEAFDPEEYWKITGYFSIEPEACAELRQQWLSWLDDAPATRNGRKSNGRSLKEKNAWLTDHECICAELVEFRGRKFEAKNIDSALEAARESGFILEEKIEGKSKNGRGVARSTLRLKGSLSENSGWFVKDIRTKRTRSHPFGPFITSTLQQSSSNLLGYSAQATMRIAQELYEGVTIPSLGSVGLITYMRTDSTHISPEAVKDVRKFIGDKFGDDYLPKKANLFSSSNKSAQDAHEAIRPTDVGIIPEDVEKSLSDRQYRLYRLIWERFVACQMADALWDSTTVKIAGPDGNGTLVFRATGRVLVFDGFYRITGIPGYSDEALLPPLEKEQDLFAFHVDPVQHFTSPPPRYTEASLVKKLEAEGIGRPSTYAQIIQVVQNRKYVEKIQNRFFATDLGKVVTDKLVEAFPEILELGYTRDMEQQLDDIEEKHADHVEMLKRFYVPFSRDLEKAYQMGHAKAETEPAPYDCPECGGKTVYRFGKNGRFLSCARYPDCKYAAPIDREGKPLEPELTNVSCPKCKEPMMLRNGRFGPFLSCRKYPECDGILNLDKKGALVMPKVPPLLTDLTCPKCGSGMNLRRGAKGPWLSCSKFPKCRGRLGWVSLEEETKNKWEKALESHEQAHPRPELRTLEGEIIGEGFRPQLLHDSDEGEG